MKLLKTTAEKKATVQVAAVGMRDIRHLLKIEATPDKLADFTFRSSEEVAFYLRGLNDHQIPVTSSLDRSKLNAAYAGLVRLQNKLDVLDSMNVTIAYEFRKESARLQPLLAETRKNLEHTRDRALTVLQRAARKQEPSELSWTAGEAQSVLSARLGRTYAQSRDFVYVTIAPDQSLCFSHYIQFEELQNVNQDYTYPDYYVVLSAVVKDGKTRLHANTLHKFRAPGGFNLGEEFLPAEVATVVNTLLASDQFVAANDTTAYSDTLTVASSTFTTPVTSVLATDSQIIAEFTGTRDACVNNARQLKHELTALLAGSMRGYVLRSRLVPKNKNQFQAQYSAVPGVEVSGNESRVKTPVLPTGQLAAIRRLLLKGF